MMFIVALIYQFHHDLFRYWEAHPETWDRIRDWCTNPPPVPVLTTATSSTAQATPTTAKPPTQHESLQDVLDRLVRPHVVQLDTQGAVANSQLANAFPDPANRNVFWPQAVVWQLEKEAELKGKPIRAKDFRTYLHQVPYVAEPTV